MRNLLRVSLSLFGVLAITAAFAQSDPASVVTPSEAETLLHVPAVDYRRDWVQLGIFSLLADEPEAGAKELHIVYAPPESVAAYRKAGVFPDGTVLIKDVFATSTESLTTGTSSYADTLIGRFVMVKDTADSYAGASPLGGDGWGWAFYEGSETKATVTTDYQQDCLGCHDPARDQDLVYVQGYPSASLKWANQLPVWF
jgi:hypothetical protein